MASTDAAMLDLLESAQTGRASSGGRAGPAEATVVGSSFDESRAIYVWLQLDGVPEPRAYALPWDKRVAEQLQTAARAAAERQSAVRMRLPFESTLDDREPRFYALPQPQCRPRMRSAPGAGSASGYQRLGGSEPHRADEFQPLGRGPSASARKDAKRLYKASSSSSLASRALR